MKVTNNEILHFRYGVYAGLIISGLTFLFGIIAGLLQTKFNLPDIIWIMIIFIFSLAAWFYVSFKTLDKLRSICKKFKPFLALFVVWGTVSSLSVLVTLLTNIVMKRPFYQEVGFSALTIFLLLIIEYSYKRSRKIK